ncbi:hypothetical protein SOASR032_29200 [Pragia fontium]|uniref:Colicin V secretion protein CvaA n=1 Tax=Pragia fontium TaxID=82985 RepID=A0ABQ5LL48_9GAMM|nr:HlyD family secretion protein [Pragia fontium]GKX64351.1 hypothetical protein SOASR032_29200 [Pragia fontium]
MMNRKRIFRQEAINNQKQQWVGKVLLLSGIPPWLISLLSTLFILALFCSLYFFHYTRRIDVEGEIITIPHSINVYSPQQGYIIKTYIKVGDMVNKGDPLYEIDVSRTTNLGNVSAGTKTLIKSQIENIDAITVKLEGNKQTTIASLQSQLEQYLSSHKETEKLIASAREGVEKMRQGMVNYERYLRSGLINKDQLNNQSYLFYQQQNAYQGLKSQGIQEDLRISELRSQILTQSADFDNQILQNEYQRNDLQRKMIESDAGDTIIISAQSSGQVESLSVTIGQMVNAGSSLAQVSPTQNKQYYLLLWLPNNSLPYIKNGDGINIRYDAFPSEKFGQFPGQIDTISYIPASREELALYTSSPVKNPNEPTENFYKVLVAIKDTSFSDKGKQMQLSSGLKARAIVFLDKRPLYEWMFIPFYGIKNSVVGPINE